MRCLSAFPVVTRGAILVARSSHSFLVNSANKEYLLMDHKILVN
jgi:hypothetical protein